jgi:hypothetical protein
MHYGARDSAKVSRGDRKSTYKVSIATPLHENTERWEDDGSNNLGKGERT